MTSDGRFDAEVQYGDWRGTAEADSADFFRDLERLFRDGGLITEEEFVVGIRVFNGENSRDELNPLYVRLYTVPATTFNEAKVILQKRPIKIREVKREMPHELFFWAIQTL